ncbi:hypothetical protein [Sulfuracidifex metallicus]|uniref:hypothetical protein n=1 Tax=Sulfuracidifex metallicus TaxID=47303 RepID=UPI002274D3D6|nr:hypothetical protein [Sulfuracidifex metallicus]MCY0849559.1 hypothetical protein [Sulfuracidifex metallicus]
MKKLVELLIVEDFSGNGKVSQKDLEDLVEKLKDGSEVIVNRIHLPLWDNKEEGLLGLHVIVRDIAET